MFLKILCGPDRTTLLHESTGANNDNTIDVDLFVIVIVSVVVVAATPADGKYTFVFVTLIIYDLLILITPVFAKKYL